MSQEFLPTPTGIEQFKDRMEGFSVVFDSDDDAVRFMQTLFADFQHDQQRSNRPTRTLP